MSLSFHPCDHTYVHKLNSSLFTNKNEEKLEREERGASSYVHNKQTCAHRDKGSYMELAYKGRRLQTHAWHEITALTWSEYVQKSL